MDPVEVRVVGVAVLGEGPLAGRVLAARRASPPELAGRWEFPGGKCEPHETLHAAAQRELREELGCDVAVTGVLPGRVEIRPGLVLHAVTARLLDGEPHAREHDEIRWVPLAELRSLSWLPADVPFVEALVAQAAPDLPSPVEES